MTKTQIKTDISNEFLELQNKVKMILARGYQLKTINPENLLASLYILGQAKNRFELENFIELFSAAFPFLKEIREEKVAEARENLEEKVKLVLSSLVKKDPLLATKIAKAALEPGMTWEKLCRAFPEIKN
ncbi:MAG TPA: hypothetical protein P5229_02205 [Candidatus Gracilibacteria bacterium]|nr:hypothetical protein [Candidatus Gracilibacteria bacterium]